MFFIFWTLLVLLVCRDEILAATDIDKKIQSIDEAIKKNPSLEVYQTLKHLLKTELESAETNYAFILQILERIHFLNLTLRRDTLEQDFDRPVKDVLFRCSKNESIGQECYKAVLNTMARYGYIRFLSSTIETVKYRLNKLEKVDLDLRLGREYLYEGEFQKASLIFENFQRNIKKYESEDLSWLVFQKIRLAEYLAVKKKILEASELLVPVRSFAVKTKNPWMSLFLCTFDFTWMSSTNESPFCKIALDESKKMEIRGLAPIYYNIAVVKLTYKKFDEFEKLQSLGKQAALSPFGPEFFWINWLDGVWGVIKSRSINNSQKNFGLDNYYSPTRSYRMRNYHDFMQHLMKPPEVRSRLLKEYWVKINRMEQGKSVTYSTLTKIARAFKF